jgi:hypothetical protein
MTSCALSACTTPCVASQPSSAAGTVGSSCRSTYRCRSRDLSRCAASASPPCAPRGGFSRLRAADGSHSPRAEMPNLEDLVNRENSLQPSGRECTRERRSSSAATIARLLPPSRHAVVTRTHLSQ